MRESIWLRRGIVFGGALALVALQACTVQSDASDGESADRVVGDGTLEAGETCDDSNTKSLDGCSSTGKFEQVQRMNSLQFQFGTTAMCTANALGGAVGGAAQGQIQDALTGAVKSGEASVLLLAQGLNDLTGATSGNFTVGSFVGKPVAGPGYDGNRDLDWWYKVPASSVDASGNPLVSLAAALNGNTITVGPGALNFSFSVAGSNAAIALSNVRGKATVGGATAPTKSANGSTPGHLASENVDPALKTFASLINGELCGNVSAASLAAIPVPQALAGGSVSCSEGYTTSNSLLDVFVGGCKVFFVTALRSTQPDQTDPQAAAVGAGAPYKFTVGSNRKVNGCKDKAGATVDFAKCKSAAAYSAAFKFGSGRVIAKVEAGAPGSAEPPVTEPVDPPTTEPTDPPAGGE